jgi:hypothetical protein
MCEFDLGGFIIPHMIWMGVKLNMLMIDHFGHLLNVKVSLCPGSGNFQKLELTKSIAFLSCIIIMEVCLMHGVLDVRM